MSVAAGGEGSEFRFPHALARATALDLMTPSRRVREHARVAEALERAGLTIRTREDHPQCWVRDYLYARR